MALLLWLIMKRNAFNGDYVQMTLLKDLRHLDLSSNCLATIPDDISLLTSLTLLDLSNNSRVVLPRTLGRLGSLVQLNLNWVWTDLTALWEGSPGLSHLEGLSVVGNGVATLPACVGGFRRLR
jgi:Leucine-rich repeat (LRR) protein